MNFSWFAQTFSYKVINFKVSDRFLNMEMFKNRELVLTVDHSADIINNNEEDNLTI